MRSYHRTIHTLIVHRWDMTALCERGRKADPNGTTHHSGRGTARRGTQELGRCLTQTHVVSVAVAGCAVKNMIIELFGFVIFFLH